MGALFMISIFSIAAIAAAGGDTRGSRYDQDDKQALAAAEAGIADYFFHLDQTPTTGRAAPERRRRHCPCHTRSTSSSRAHRRRVAAGATCPAATPGTRSS